MCFVTSVLDSVVLETSSLAEGMLGHLLKMSDNL